MNVTSLPASLAHVGIGAIALLMLSTAPANAVVNCNSTVTFSTNTTLSDDYIQTTASSDACITMTNGADLNLNGHTITRNVNQDYSSRAGVRCTAPGSSITGGGIIRGTFYRGTEDCEIVNGITIGRFQPTGASIPLGPVVGISASLLVARADVITNNVIDNGDVHGIIADMLTTDSYITNNYIQALIGIQVSGSNGAGQGPLVQGNLVRHYGTGVLKADSTEVRILKNLFIDRDVETDHCIDAFGFGGGATVDDNWCECATDCLNAPPWALPFF